MPGISAVSPPINLQLDILQPLKIPLRICFAGDQVFRQLYSLRKQCTSSHSQSLNNIATKSIPIVLNF